MELALLGDFDIQRAAILARVSTDDQVKGTSLTSQIEDCRQKAKDSNFLVAESDIYVEEGVSGALPIERRPKLQALFDRAEKGYYQALICYSPDRLSRKTVYQLLYEDEAKSLGCSVIFVTETFDDSPEGEFTKIVRAAVSELERATITRRTLKGRKASLERGGYSGGSKPFGYNWSKDQGWTIDGNQANIVRQVFQWYVYGGLSLREIARKLNELAIPLPKGKTDSYWSNSQVNVLISQPAYVGVYYGLRGKSHKKFDSIERLNSFASESGWTLIPNFPAILVDGNGDPNIDLWESAQRKRGANRTGGVGHRTLNWPLQGKIRCAECDHQLRCRQNHSKGKRVYRCHTGRDSYEIGRQKCATPGVAAENIERSVASYLTGALREPDQLEIAAQEYLGVLESRIFELEVAARPLDPDIDEIRSKIKRINRLYIDGDIEEKEHDDL